jgi:hypothetical protein
MEKNKRARIVFICAAAIALFFAFNNSNKDKIVRLVNNHLELLNKYVENKAYDKIYEIKGIKRITPYFLSDNEVYIDYYCYGFGLAPGSTYYGFYYVSNDKPSGFQGTSIKLELDGNG